MTIVPNIDLSQLDPADAGCEAARTLDRACRESGFFLVSGHGLEPRFEEVWRAAEWFFHLPQERKAALLRSEDNSRGYFNRELTKNTRDMKEVFDFGSVPNPALPEDHPDNRTQDGWNLWPTGEGADEFRAVMQGYFDACHGVAMKLLRAMTHNLGAPTEELVSDFQPGHSSFLRLNYYPVHDPQPEEGGSGIAADTGHMGVHHHTDAGALTLLLQDDVGGLQIRHRDKWIDVPPEPDTLVINIGDIVQVWSNDRYPAPLHRVVASTGQDRYSLPYFFNPVYEATYRPLDATTSSVSPARYRPIRWGHFRHERQHGDYGDYGDEIQISDFRTT